MRKRLETVNNVFGKLQIASSAFFSLTHGANDGQKTMGIITALLIAGGFLHETEFKVPFWVVVSAAAAIGFGTFFGGWRIVKTMAFSIQANSFKTISGFLCGNRWWCYFGCNGIVRNTSKYLLIPYLVRLWELEQVGDFLQLGGLWLARLLWLG